MRNDELQKNLSEKNMRLKEMMVSVSVLQERQAEICLMKEDIANKEHAIHIMDDTIVSLSKENQDLRSDSKNLAYKLEQKLILMENQFQLANSKAVSRQE